MARCSRSRCVSIMAPRSSGSASWNRSFQVITKRTDETASWGKRTRASDPNSPRSQARCAISLRNSMTGCTSSRWQKAAISGNRPTYETTSRAIVSRSEPRNSSRTQWERKPDTGSFAPVDPAPAISFAAHQPAARWRIGSALRTPPASRGNRDRSCLWRFPPGSRCPQDALLQGLSRRRPPEPLAVWIEAVLGVPRPNALTEIPGPGEDYTD